MASGKWQRGKERESGREGGEVIEREQGQAARAMWHAARWQRTKMQAILAAIFKYVNN